MAQRIPMGKLRDGVALHANCQGIRRAVARASPALASPRCCWATCASVEWDITADVDPSYIEVR